MVSARPDSTSLQEWPALRAGLCPEMAWARELARFQRGEPVAPPYVVQLGRYALETILFFRRDTNDEPAGTANGGSLRARCRGNTFHLLLQAHASLDKNSHDSDILCLSLWSVVVSVIFRLPAVLWHCAQLGHESLEMLSVHICRPPN